MRELLIDNYPITDDNPPYVIAEIGHNHMGDVEICKEMFQVAKECGANAVKLQKRNNKKLFTKALYNAPYENENSYGKTYGEHREALEFGWEEYENLKTYAKEIDITFFATAFDFDSVDFLANLGVPAIKIASWDCKNIPLIKYAAAVGIPLIISTGGAELVDIRRAYHVLQDNRFAFLHCVSSYPNQAHELNLKSICSLREYFPDTVIGFSNHYSGIVPMQSAYLLGARIIETHFTLNHAWKGTDHALSLEPNGLRQLVENLKIMHQSVGDGIKIVSDSERAAIHKQGNAVHALRTINKGETITERNVGLKAPANGLPPYEYENVLNRTAREDISTAMDFDWRVIK